MTSPLGVAVVVVYIRRFIYKFLNVCGCCGEWEGWARNLVNHTQLDGCCYLNWPSLAGPQSLCNRTFWWHFCCHFASKPVWNFCRCKGFCHRTESDLFLFSSYFYSSNAIIKKNSVIPHTFYEFKYFHTRIFIKRYPLYGIIFSADIYSSND